MEHPYGKQYGQEGNPRAYMTMRDYRNLPYQWGNQQPVRRNPNPPRSMREYRDQYMRAPVYHAPSTYPPPPQYGHPEPPFNASTPQSPQSQQPPPLSPVEQAVLNLSKMICTIQEEQKVHLSNMQDEISKLSNQLLQSSEKEKGPFQTAIPELVKSAPVVAEPPQEEESVAKEESREDECMTETILGEQVQLQPQEDLEVESLETPEELQDAPVNFWPWTKEKEITALLTEKSSEHEGTQEPIVQPNPQAIPIDLDTIATAQATKNPLPTAPSTDQVYILPASQSQHKTPAAPKAKSNPLHVVQNFKELVASVYALATTSKTMATAYIAWHSGWFGCGFGFGTPGPRHF